MKKSDLLILAIPILIGVASCSTDANSLIPANSSTTDIVQQGSWVITLYDDSGEDETGHFSSYLFTFDSTGTVTAVKDSISIPGTWISLTDDNINEIYLDFGSASPLNELNDDWDIIEKSSVKIRLKDVSGGNEPDDLLTFEKVL
jgi:hypothetical protein